MTSSKHRIGIIVGSLRRDSINRKIANSIAAFTSDWLECDFIAIGDLPLYNEDDDGNPVSAVQTFRERVRTVDGGMPSCSPSCTASWPAA